MSLKKWFSGFLKREVVAPLDKQVLDAVRSRLTPNAQAIWDEQVSSLGRCQVIPVLGTEVDYWYRSGESPRSYPHYGREERRLATVRFRCDGIEYKARVYLVAGHLFSIVYSKDVRRIRRREDVEILSVQLHSDPMEPATPPTELQVVTDLNSFAPLKGWLADWVAEHGVMKIVFPLNPKEREALLRQRRLRLPADYLELLEQCDGFSSQEHSVLGVASMYEVGIGEEVYWLLAERGGAFIVAKEGDTQPRVYYIHHEDGVPAEEFTSFREALQYLLAQPNLP